MSSSQAAAYARNQRRERFRTQILSENPLLPHDEVERRADAMYSAACAEGGRASARTRQRRALLLEAYEENRAELVEQVECLLALVRSGPDITRRCDHSWPAELDADAACEVCGLAYIEFT